MRFASHKKAEGLKGKVYIQGNTFNKAWFSFYDINDPPVVCLAFKVYNDVGSKYSHIESCTCKAHSIIGGLPQIDMKNLCAYVIAVHKRLPFEKSELFKEK